MVQRYAPSNQLKGQNTVFCEYQKINIGANLNFQTIDYQHFTPPHIPFLGYVFKQISSNTMERKIKKNKKKRQ